MNRLVLCAVFFICGLLQASPTNGIRIIFTGDVLLAYELEKPLKQYGLNYPFLAVKDILSKADILCGNLECPISDYGSPMQNKSFYFQAPTETVGSLLFAGYNVMSLANNHILDFGDSSLRQTMQVLQENGIGWFGAGTNAAQAHAMKVVNVRGQRIGFLGFSMAPPDAYFAEGDQPGTSGVDPVLLKKLVSENRSKADFLVVFFHWGIEYLANPEQYQVKLGRLAIDSGADAVIGCHPHVIQPVEIYKGRPIVYSLGNFAFGSYGKPPEHSAELGLIFSVNLRGKDRTYEIYPVNVFNYEVRFKPRPLKGEAAASALKYLQSISSGYGTKIRIEDDRGIIQ
jgi:poly-gamma-glutamate capsule biosynthesis protein CapA/YwtB (metallophosphatase superfamily)